jgi:hypothetical protein
LYQQVAATLRRELASGRHKPGERFASQNELARRFGTNATTAREAVALLVHDGWLTRRFGSGTYVAERAARPAVGIYSAFDFLVPRASPFHFLLPHYLREFLNGAGIDAGIYIGSRLAEERPSLPADRRFVDDVAGGRLDALAILTGPVGAAWENWIRNLAIPAVGSGTDFRVDIGYGDMLRRSVRLLAAQGCRRIALLSWSEAVLGPQLRDALQGCGLEFHPEWVQSSFNPMLTGSGWSEFREVWAARREKPDGLIIADDVLFEDARIAIHEMGLRVPEQLRVVTHAIKGSGVRYSFPVTLAQVDVERYAALLGGMLVKLIRGEEVKPPMPVLPLELVETRPATAPATAGNVAREAVEVGVER